MATSTAGSDPRPRTCRCSRKAGAIPSRWGPHARAARDPPWRLHRLPPSCQSRPAPARRAWPRCASVPGREPSPTWPNRCSGPERRPRRPSRRHPRARFLHAPPLPAASGFVAGPGGRVGPAHAVGAGDIDGQRPAGRRLNPLVIAGVILGLGGIVAAAILLSGNPEPTETANVPVGVLDVQSNPPGARVLLDGDPAAW